MEKNNLIEVKNLKTYFYLDQGVVKAVDDVSFNIKDKRSLGIIGESGCGKSVTAQSILRIVPSPPGKIVEGSINLRRLNGGIDDLVKMDPFGEEIRSIRGNDISLIFQEPMTSFGPLNTIGDQVMEVILLHNDISEDEARERVIKMMDQVGIPKPEQRIDDYPHQFSGGMRQRAMIAMALACSPRLLIADEPTTSVDVTIEAQVLDLLRDLQEERGMAIMLITHNLAVVSELAHDIGVMYLGKMVENSTTERIFNNPLHPYTKALWRSIPKLEGELERLVPIEGVVPSPFKKLQGCVFYPRCEERIDGVCNGKEFPPQVEVEPGHYVRCFKYV
ncbi:MAG: ABC transporter ATP-binding protein [Bacillota bacterium]